MRRGTARILGTLLSPSNARACVQAFAQRSFGKLSAFDDGWLPLFTAAVDPATTDPVAFRELVATCLTLQQQQVHGPIAPSALVAEIVREAVLTMPETSPYFASRRWPGAQRGLHTTLEALRAWGFSAATLLERADEAEGPAAERFRALAALELVVEQTLGRLHFDLEPWRLRRCIEHPLDGREARLAPLLLVAGEALTPLRLEWVQWYLDHGGDVTLVVEHHPGLPLAFPNARRLAAALEVDIEPVGTMPPIAKHLFQDTSAEPGETELCIESSADELSEIEWALRGMQRRAAQGIALERMALFCRNLGEMAPLIRSAASILNVPLALRSPQPLLTNGFAHWSLSLLQALGDPGPRRFVELMRSSYGLGRADARATWSRLEVATEDAYRFAGEEWQRLQQAFPEPLITDGEPNLFALESVASPADDGVAALLAWRSRHATAERTRGEWLHALREWMDSTAMQKALEEGGPTAMRDTVAAREMLDTAERRALACLRGHETISYGEIVQEWAAAWTDAQVSESAGRAGLLVTDQPEAAAGSAHVHVLGMLEGVFPRRRREDPMLPDADRAILRLPGEVDWPLPDSHDRAHGERDLFIRLCVAAPAMTLSYSTADDDRDNVPAFYLSEAARAAGVVERVHHPRTVAAVSASEAINPFDAAMAEALQRPMRPSVGLDVQDETVAAVAWKAEEPMSLAEIRDAAICPFRYTMRRRLGLYDRRQGIPIALSQLQRSIPVQSATDLQSAQDMVDHAIEAELDQARAHMEGSDWALLRARARKLGRVWIDREFASRSLWPRDPDGVQLQPQFDGQTLAAELPLGEVSLRLRGGIGALSHLGRYAVAHVGGVRKSLVEANAERLTDADKVELVVLFAALRQQDRAPAIEMTATSGEKALFVLERYDDQPLAANQGQQLRVVSLNSRETRFMSEARQVLERVVKRVQSDPLSVVPGDHCTHCAYGELCRRGQAIGEPSMPEEAS